MLCAIQFKKFSEAQFGSYLLKKIFLDCVETELAVKKTDLWITRCDEAGTILASDKTQVKLLVLILVLTLQL